MKKVLFFLAIMLALPACHRFPSTTNRRTLNLRKEAIAQHVAMPNTQSAMTPSVTVWIHGTRGFKPFDELMHAAPPGNGLQLISSLNKTYNRFKTMTKTIADTDPVNYPFEHFYIFGWSGDLSFEIRQKAAEQLHQELEKLVVTYTNNYGHAPFIRLITHSHGGNVALNLATIEHPNKEWLINEAILLACPVQHKTEHLIKNKIFGKIYSLYSTIDTVQIADPQGLYKKIRRPEDKGVLSQRRFPDNKKLMQVKLRVNNHGIPHTCFTFCNVLKILPSVIHYLNQWEEEQPHTAHEVRQLNVLM